MFTIILVIVLVAGGMAAKVASKMKRIPEGDANYDRDVREAHQIKKALRYGGTAGFTIGCRFSAKQGGAEGSRA